MKRGVVLSDNVLRHLDGRPLLPDYDGHTNCFIETGHDKALLIDFNYETEPLPGKFPLPGLGPFSLLQESHVNHWGKLAFGGAASTRRWCRWRPRRSASPRRSSTTSRSAGTSTWGASCCT